MNRIPLIIGLLAIAQISIYQISFASSSSSSCSSTSNSLETPKPVEKREILAKIIKSVPDDKSKEYRNNLFRATQRLLDDSYGRQPRNILNAAGKNLGGQAFPLDPSVFLKVLNLCEGKAVLEVGAAGGEHAFLLGLGGAAEVVINDIEPLEIAQCTRQLQSLPGEAQEKFKIVPGDCLSVFNEESYSEKFDVILARNIIHYFFGEKREQFIRTMYRLLKPGGCIIVTTNAAQQYFSQELLERYKHHYTVKQRVFALRTPGENTPFFVDHTMVNNLENFDPLKYNYVPVVRFTQRGAQYEDFYRKLSTKDRETIKERVNALISQKGIKQLVKDGITLEILETHSIAYTKDTMVDAFASTDLVLQTTLLTKLEREGTSNDDDNDSNQCQFGQLTVFFEKPLKN